MARMDRFTKRAKQVLVDAKYEAQRFDHTYIGTEHLLLGLIPSDGTAGDVLRALNIDLSRAQRRRIRGGTRRTPERRSDRTHRECQKGR